jgi:UDP-N-acetylglucosamine transferase subunit ALG13
MQPLVFVTVGTDHHPFDRLIDWIEQWPARPQADLVLQYGSSRPIEGATCRELLDPDQMQSLLHSADAVVCAGGPSTVMDARHAGRRPIVVPRRASLGEHVDDHQAAFARHLEREGLAVVADSFADLTLALDRAFVDPQAHRIPSGQAAPAAIRRIGDLVDDLVAGS